VTTSIQGTYFLFYLFSNALNNSDFKESKDTVTMNKELKRTCKQSATLSPAKLLQQIIGMTSDTLKTRLRTRRKQGKLKTEPKSAILNTKALGTANITGLIIVRPLQVLVLMPVYLP
jgi:hypothetical protein